MYRASDRLQSESSCNNVSVLDRISVTLFRCAVPAYNIWVLSVHIEYTDIS